MCECRIGRESFLDHLRAPIERYTRAIYKIFAFLGVCRDAVLFAGSIDCICERDLIVQEDARVLDQIVDRIRDQLPWASFFSNVSSDLAGQYFPCFGCGYVIFTQHMIQGLVEAAALTN
jgi:hypothetical protein